MLREGLIRIAQEYRTAKQQDLRDYPLAKFIRDELPASIERAIAGYESAEYLKVTGPTMPGNWARIPWLAVLDTRITSTPQKGIYLVYAFSEDMNRAYLNLGIGVTDTTTNEQRALLHRIQELYPEPDGFLKGPLPTGSLSNIGIGSKYEKVMIFYKQYDTVQFPDELTLLTDLEKAVRLLTEIASTWPLRGSGVVAEEDKIAFTIRGLSFLFSPADVIAL